MNSQNTNDLYTPDEHVILSEWLEVPPICAQEDLPYLDDALERLGFLGGAIERFDEDAAVAHIVLSAIQERLPQWAAVEIDAVGNATIHTARPIQKARNKKKIELKPQHLITINWANTGPGISWPAAYHLTWLPHYDVNIVTVSADGPELYGYCDFAVGYFGGSEQRITKASNLVATDWALSAADTNQPRWSEIIEEGLIREQLAAELVSEIWQNAEA